MGPLRPMSWLLNWGWLRAFSQRTQCSPRPMVAAGPNHLGRGGGTTAPPPALGLPFAPGDGPWGAQALSVLPVGVTCASVCVPSARPRPGAGFLVIWQSLLLNGGGSVVPGSRHLPPIIRPPVAAHLRFHPCLGRGVGVSWRRLGGAPYGAFLLPASGGGIGGATVRRHRWGGCRRVRLRARRVSS